MKKIIAGLAALVLGASSLFAWTNIVDLGITGSIPEKIETTGKNSSSYTFNNIGIDIGYIGIFDSNLAIKAATKVGLGSVDAAVLDAFTDPEIGPLNINATETIGVGYGFINTDNLFLGVFGNIGASCNVGVAAREDDDYRYATSVVSSTYFIGADISAVYTPTSIFSIYGSVSANIAYGMVTSGSIKQNLSNRDDIVTDSKEHLTKPYFKLIPTIGVAWKF